MRDVILGGQIERDSDVDDKTPPKGYFLSPFTRKEILEKQRDDDFCQAVIPTKVGLNFRAI